MTGPTSIEILRALLHALDRQAAVEREQAAERAARVVSQEDVLTRIRTGTNTWNALFAYYPESEWSRLQLELTAIQRAELAYRLRDLTFVLGRRPDGYR
jgi:hypothetical protein